MKYTRKNSQIITSLKDLKILAKRMTKLQEFAFDTETNTLRVYGKSITFSVSGKTSKTYIRA